MALARKHRRRLVVAGTTYVWWIADDEMAPGGPVLTVATDDRGVYVQYYLARPAGERVVTVVGTRFRGFAGPRPRSYRAPDFDIDIAVQPRHVAALIGWILEPGALPPAVDWRSDLTA
jgi:hypothetical protein